MARLESDRDAMPERGLNTLAAGEVLSSRTSGAIASSCVQIWGWEAMRSSARKQLTVDPLAFLTVTFALRCDVSGKSDDPYRL
jgi:hypothetical protein